MTCRYISWSKIKPTLKINAVSKFMHSMPLQIRGANVYGLRMRRLIFTRAKNWFCRFLKCRGLHRYSFNSLTWKFVNNHKWVTMTFILWKVAQCDLHFMKIKSVHPDYLSYIELCNELSKVKLTMKPLICLDRINTYTWTDKPLHHGQKWKKCWKYTFLVLWVCN